MTPKKIGSLGVRNVHVWNQAAVGKIAWHIHVLQESLWVRRVHGVYTKEARWGICNAPITTSWTIKKLCALTTVLRQWICSLTYSIKKVYEHIVLDQHRVRWKHLVWNRLSIPKNRFVCWLAAQRGLKTKEKLFQLGVVDDVSCPLCGLCPETHTHLFFECPFSHLCLAGIKSWLGITFRPIARMHFRKRHLSMSKQ